MIFVERLVHLAFREQPFMHFKPERPFHQRFMFLEEQIVCVRTIDPPDLVYIAEPLGDKQSGPRARAFEHRIDRHGRSVQKNIGIGKGGVRLGGTGCYPVDQGIWRRQRFAEMKAPGRRVEGGDIRKGAADIRGQSYSPRRFVI